MSGIYNWICTVHLYICTDYSGSKWVLCKVPKVGGTLVLGMLCTRCGFSFSFFFFLEGFFWGLVLVLVEEKERKRKKKGKKGKRKTLTIRTLVVAYLILQKRKPKSLFSYSRYLLYNLSSYTYTHFFFLSSFFKFFLVHCWGCFFFSVQLFPFPRPPFPRSHPS